MPRDRSSWAAFAGMGVLNNLIPFTLIFWGQTQIPSALAAILNATTPLWGVVFAHFLTRDERMRANRLGGVLLGFAGVVVMVGPAALGGMGAAGLAQLAVVAAAVSYAFAGIFGRRFKATPPMVTATGQVTTTTVMMLPVALLVDRPWDLPMPGVPSWGAVLGLALLSTALAYVIFFRILAAAGATNILLVTFLIPVSALVLGMLVLGERLDPGHFAGMALIALGLGAIDGRPLGSLAALWPRKARGAG
jgi:drug/metabolite transporter (DMT)-like permease